MAEPQHHDPGSEHRWRAGWAWIGDRLLGYAADPMLQYLGQGACQAMADGRVRQHTVATESARLRMSMAGLSAVELFTRERAPRTDRVRRIARTAGESWQVDGIARTVGNIRSPTASTTTTDKPTGSTART